MGNPFAQTPMPPSASLNRVRIRADRPWARPWAGRLAGTILDRASWGATVVGAFPDLRDEPDPLLALDAAMARGRRADAVAADLGARLAALVSTLVEGGRTSREERAEWNAGAWSFWGSRSVLVIGGGLLAGRLGPIVLESAAALVGEAPRLVLAPSPRDLPLIGAARSAPDGDSPVFAMDLGQSSLKRAVASVRGGEIVRFDRLPTIAVDAASNGPEILSLLAEAVESFDGGAARIAVCSYVEGSGNPVPEGFVGRLRTLADDVPALLGESISNRLGRPVRASLLHDGSAAALALDVHPEAAVLVFGSSIGVGVPRRKDGG